MTRTKRLLAAILIFALLLSGCAKSPEKVRHVPVLLYHHLLETADGSSSITAAQFRAQMELLKTNGYQPVSLTQLIDFAEQGTPLPENPVVITFDDGYYSNYQYAYPILKEYDFPATIFAIGCSIGHMEFYKDTAYPLTPHFGAAEIAKMRQSGLISVQSHTYDMHQWAPFETGDAIRENVLPLEGETEEDYVAALTADHQTMAQLLAASGAEPTIAVAFPHGKTNPLATSTLQTLGVKITLTTDETRRNTVIAGKPETLIDMGRFDVSATTTDAQILKYLKK